MDDQTLTILIALLLVFVIAVIRFNRGVNWS